MEIKIRIDGIKPVSTNEMYSYGRKTVRKSDKYRAYESMTNIYIRETSDIMESGEIERFKEELERDYRLAIRGYFRFYIPRRSYFRVDTSNYIKATEDIIKNIIGIDDSRNVSIVGDKYLSEDKEWHIEVVLEVYQLEYEIPKDKWSKNILGDNKRGRGNKIKSRIRPIKNRRSKRSKKSEDKGKESSSIELTDEISKDNKINSIKIGDNIEIILLI